MRAFFDPPERGTGIVSADTDFGDQHDAHSVALDTIMMFDNTGDATQSRVLKILLDPVGTATTTGTATIVNMWGVVDADGDPLTCAAQGSAQLTGSSVLAMCNERHVIEELGAAAELGGTFIEPDLFIRLVSPACSGSGPTNPAAIGGWYRAFPLQDLGDF